MLCANIVLRRTERAMVGVSLRGMSTKTPMTKEEFDRRVARMNAQKVFNQASGTFLDIK